MSPGNLYRYFPSKEAIIAGIAERDRAEVFYPSSPRPSNAPDFLSGPGGAWPATTSPSAAPRRIALCAEIIGREPPQTRGQHASSAPLRRRREGQDYCEYDSDAAGARGDVADLDIDVESSGCRC